MNKYEVVVRTIETHTGHAAASTEVVCADKYVDGDGDGVLRFYRADVLSHSFARDCWIGVTSDVDDDLVHHTVVRHKTNQVPALIEFEIEAKSGKGRTSDDGKSAVLEIGVGKRWKILTLDGAELGTITT